MDFAFSEEQDAFRETLRRFLEDKSPSSQVRRTMESLDGYDRSLWKQMAEQLGLQGLHIPDVYGGQGFGYLELAIAMYEMGRALLCAPYFSTLCLAANAILAAGSEAQKRALLPDLANGSSLATLALLEANGSWEANAVENIVRRILLRRINASLRRTMVRLQHNKFSSDAGHIRPSRDEKPDR